MIYVIILNGTIFIFKFQFPVVYVFVFIEIKLIFHIDTISRSLTKVLYYSVCFL